MATKTQYLKKQKLLGLREFVVALDGAKARAIAASDAFPDRSVGIGGLGDRRGGRAGGDDAGVIYDVLVLSAKSRNNRVYSREAMKSAMHLYEGANVFTDHPTSVDRDRKGRSAADRFGRLCNVRFCDGPKGPQLRGDLHFLKSHPLAVRVQEDLERGLHLFGLSHLADGSGTLQKDGSYLITSIDRLIEIDIVTNPATATSLREQTQNAGRVQRPVGRPAVQTRVPTEPKELARWLKTSPSR